LALSLTLGVVLVAEFYNSVLADYQVKKMTHPTYPFRDFFYTRLSDRLNLAIYLLTISLAFLNLETDVKARFFPVRVALLPLRPGLVFVAKLVVVAAIVLLTTLAAYAGLPWLVEAYQVSHKFTFEKLSWAAILHYWAEQTILILPIIASGLAFWLYFNRNIVLTYGLFLIIYYISFLFKGLYPFGTYNQLFLIEESQISLIKVGKGILFCSFAGLFFQHKIRPLW
jgi:hypothetical protein